MRGGSRNIIVPGGAGGAGGAPTDATYIVQTAHGDLSDEQALSSLASGYMKVTTATGVVSSQAVPIPIADGGTNGTTATAAFDNLAPTTTAGDIIFHNGTDNVRLAAGTAGQVLQMNAGATAPAWGTAASVPFFFGNGLGAGFAPTDNTNHYLGAAANPTNTAPTAANSVNAVKMRRAGTITDVHFGILVAGTNGSAETGSLMIRVNDTTDYTIFNNTIAWNVGAVFTAHDATSLTHALASGDYWVVKLDPPTWATNPTAVFYFCQVVVTYP
jgi:hypothetical protein